MKCVLAVLQFDYKVNANKFVVKTGKNILLDHLFIREDMKIKGHSKCNYCGKRKSNPIKLFLTGQDGPASVLATSLYQQLVQDSKKVIKNRNQTSKSSLGIFDDIFKESTVTLEDEVELNHKNY